MKDEAIKLGINLKRIRSHKGTSQSQIATELKVGRGFISNIENGKSNPTLSTITKIAKVLNITVHELLK